MEVRIENVIDNYLCGDYIFNSNFDSGNLGKVEFVKSYFDQETENNVHSEYNVWTTPDCYGTPNESPNRTWFFFSIKGGRSYRNVKINVKNLNRQAKLFNQGMQPVMRIGQKGKWERIKDKPTYGMEMDNFCISFIHHSLEQPNIEHYYAFTYPFTYTDCQNLLEKFDKKYKKSAQDITCILNRILDEQQFRKGYDGHLEKKREDSGNLLDKSKIEGSDLINNSTNYKQKFISSAVDGSIYESYTPKEILDEIYYHRELLIWSLENRRVDLITISSFHGIQEKCEDRLNNLFPNEQEDRCRCFKNKKIIFLSSRVHPGETPASFVLNGFLNLLLDKKSVIASTLRQLYVFKIVPILNPDGVFRGFYRTDTLGQNLNRMYMNPKLDIHPSIYAVKKLIKYYHFGFQYCTEDNNNHDIASDTCVSSERTNSSSSLSENAKCDSKFEIAIAKEGNINSNKILNKNEENSTDSYKDCPTTSDEGENMKLNLDNNSNINKKNFKKSKILNKKLISENKTTIRGVPTRTISEYQFISKNETTHNLKKSTVKTILGVTHNLNNRNKTQKLKFQHSKIQPRSGNKKILHQKDLKIGSSKIISPSISNKQINGKNILSHCNVNSNMSIKSDNTYTVRDIEEKSNVFLYIDFHGHASKKGVFMYGNYFPNSLEAVECMLLPRLMSINCHHFHYDACNFSERNMYRREKRDGLSKEGSGRVAVYKMTGLIKSYTLESNYNTGRYVNILPGRGKDTTSKVGNITPPRYTPAVYEEVGRALGPSILDLTNSNCLSRINNSDFRSLQGLRIILKNEIERNCVQRSGPHTTTKVLSAHQNIKRMKINSHSASSTLSSVDTTKENKTIYSIQWRSTLPSSASTSSTQSKNQQHKLTRNVKKASLKFRTATLFGKKECLSITKKPKILAEHSVSNKYESSFHVPTKKIKVVSKAAQCITAPKTLESQIAQSFVQKTELLLNNEICKITDNVERCSKQDEVLLDDCQISTNINTNTKDAILQEKSLQSEFHESDLSQRNIVKLWNGSVCSSSDPLSITRLTGTEEEAIPSSSCTHFSSTVNLNNTKKNMKINKYPTNCNISSENNSKTSNNFDGKNCLKLRKKNVVRHETVILKRKKGNLRMRFIK